MSTPLKCGFIGTTMYIVQGDVVIEGVERWYDLPSYDPETEKVIQENNGIIVVPK